MADVLLRQPPHHSPTTDKVVNAIGSLDSTAQLVELHGSINCALESEDHARVFDGASDLLAEVFGSSGGHVRAVIGILWNFVPTDRTRIAEAAQRWTDGGFADIPGEANRVAAPPWRG